MWQELYEELKAHGFVVIALAFDSEPELTREWVEGLTFPCLVDREQRTNDLYDITNLRQMVWIDEHGRIVRPPETDGTYNETLFPALGGDEVAQRELDRTQAIYRDAIRDWVAKGDESEFALSEREARARMRQPDDGKDLAGVQFRLGQYLFEQGETEEAEACFREAMRLVPDNWAYMRQGMEAVQEDGAHGPEFYEAFARRDRDLYDRPKMPGLPS